MGTIGSQITSLTIVYSTVYWGSDQSKHQSSASLAFVRGIHRGPVNSPHKWPVTRKMFPFDDVIMLQVCFTDTGAIVCLESPSGRDIFCLKTFDTFTRTAVRVSKMNAVARAQLTFQMLTLLKKIPIFFRLVSLTLGQSYDCPSVSETSLKNMGKLDRYKITQHNKDRTVCVSLYAPHTL